MSSQELNTIRFKTIYPTLEKFTEAYNEFGLYVPTVSLDYVYKSLFSKFANRMISYIGTSYFEQSFMYDLGIELTDYDFKVLNSIPDVDYDTITTVIRNLGKTQNSEMIRNESPQDLDLSEYETGKDTEVLSSEDDETSTTTVTDKQRLEIQMKLGNYTRDYFNGIFKKLMKHFSMFDYYEGDDLDYGYTE